MTASWWFLAFAVWGALFTAVALRPPRRPVALLGATFFAAWLTTELAIFHLAWQLVVTLLFVSAGALSSWPGWVALAIMLVSWVGLAFLVTGARRTDHVFDEALDDALGPAWRDRVDSHDTSQLRTGIEWARVFMPFRFKRKGVERVRNLQYVDDGRRRHRLDVYRRADTPPGAPVLLQVHGGGWVIGNKDQQGLPLMYHLAARGWVCVAINYRLSPKATWPDHLVDCKHAIAWIREHIAEYGGDPDYIVVTGGSAGGHLTAMIGLTANEAQLQPGFENVDTSVRAMIPFYGVFDFTDRFGIRTGRNRRDPLRRVLERMVVKQDRDAAPEVFENASPMSHISAAAPPALVVHGSLDTLAPIEEAREFVRLLRDASREPVVYVELRGAHHAFEIFHSIRELHTLAGVDEFLGWLLATNPPAGRKAAPAAAAADGDAAAARASATSGPMTTARMAP